MLTSRGASSGGDARSRMKTDTASSFDGSSASARLASRSASRCATRSPDAVARAAAVAEELLGGHVARRAEAAPARLGRHRNDALVLVARPAVNPRDAPIEHVHLAIVAEHHVRWLEIAMDDAALVREMDSHAD